MLSKLLPAFLLCSLGIRAVWAGPMGIPERPAGHKPLEPGQWRIPQGYQEMSLMSEEEIYPPHLRKRADDHERLKLQNETTLIFKASPKKKGKRDDWLEGLTKEEFKDYLAKIKVEPFSEDLKKHPIIQFDNFKDLVKGGKPDMSKISSYMITLDFVTKSACESAQKAWDLNPKDPKDYFYLVIDTVGPESPDTKRATPFQVQTVKTEGTTAKLEAYPMAWDVMGKLDIGIYTNKPKTGLSKRFGVDLNPNMHFDINFNDKEKKNITMFQYPFFDLTPKAEIDQRYKITCQQCYATGSIDLAARFQTSWWWVTEASVTAAAKFDAALDVVLAVEADKKRDFKSDPYEWPFRLWEIPCTPLTIFGIINFGPKINMGAVATLKLTGKITAGLALKASIDTKLHLDLADLKAFDPSTIKGPEVSVKPHLDKAVVEATAGLALSNGFAISLDILNSGVESVAELLLPKFEYKLAGGYNSKGYCKNNGVPNSKKARREVKAISAHEQSTLAVEKRRDEPVDMNADDNSGKWGISAVPSIGFQVKFTGLKGKGVLKDIIPEAGTWKPEFLNQMFPMGGEVCGSFGEFKKPKKMQIKSGEKDHKKPMTEREKQVKKVEEANARVRQQQNAYWDAHKRQKLGDVVPEITFSYKKIQVEEEVEEIVEQNVEKDFIYTLNGETKTQKGSRKEKKKIMKKIKVDKMQKYFTLTTTDEGKYIIGNKKEFTKPMIEFQRYISCKMKIKDPRTGNYIFFLACLSDNPLVRSQTACPFTEELKPLKAWADEKSDGIPNIILCQGPSVYAVKDWV
ncbi:hypothetical protein TWF694_005989 [Orbilia ellipsospora]|uniref:Uncharacterized protein n=1 Tax=Orbilia ellipsospora TaxID=2528407 RepID=A0AAV9WR59_9PEZI